MDSSEMANRLTGNVCARWAPRFGAIFVIVLCAWNTAWAEAVKFPTPVEHCVAWKTRKKMFLFDSTEPVGISCRFESRLRLNADGTGVAELNIPIKSFDSKDKGRDDTVFEILKGDQQPNLILRTMPMQRPELESIWSRSKGTLDVQIEIGHKTSKLQFQYETYLRGSVRILHGVVKTTFTQLGMQPPSAGGGLVAKVDDVLELHAQLRRDRFLTVEDIKPAQR